MAESKKGKAKKPKKVTNDVQEWNWTPQRRKVAELLSTGLYTQKSAAEEVGVRADTVSKWKQYPQFWEEVDRLTLKNEMATRGGLLRLAYQGVNANKVNLIDDKNTSLDWAKFITDLLPEDTKDSDDKINELIAAIYERAGKKQ